jgi:hypothetical protein
MGLNPNLEEAMKMAVRETILFITQRFPKLTREEAYMIASDRDPRPWRLGRAMSCRQPPSTNIVNRCSFAN